VKPAIVCNTGPLIALGLLGRMDLLPARFGEVLVPRAVQHEILNAGVADAAVAAIRQAVWLTVTDLAYPLNPALLAMLDRGEAEVLALAAERRFAQVLLDERKGRKVARAIMGLHPIGTARLLVDAELAGQLPSALTELNHLRQAGYWLDDAILEWAARSLRK
jgi:predicted nucleic acid-binding protein